MIRAIVSALLVGGSLALAASALAGMPAPAAPPRHRFDWWGVMLAWTDGE